MNESRYNRQLDILHPKLLKVPVTIIGAGATGSFTALSLAKMGVHDLTVYDFDVVDEHNLSNQFYRTCDIGKPKVEALYEIIESFEGTRIRARNEKYKGQRLSGIVIVCVDSMDTRIQIWKFVKMNPAVPLFVDSRMGAEVMRIHSVNPNDLFECRRYEAHLYPSSEALQERCTAKTILYTVLSIASLIANQVKKYLSGEGLNQELIFDMKTITFVT